MLPNRRVFRTRNTNSIITFNLCNCLEKAIVSDEYKGFKSCFYSLKKIQGCVYVCYSDFNFKEIKILPDMIKYLMALL